MLIRGEGCEKDEDTGCNFVLMAAEDGVHNYNCNSQFSFIGLSTWMHLRLPGWLSTSPVCHGKALHDWAPSCWRGVDRPSLGIPKRGDLGFGLDFSELQ